MIGGVAVASAVGLICLYGNVSSMHRDAPIIAYGKDGPAFERLCPNCARFLKFPKTINYRERWDGICEFKKIRCSRCGPVEAVHVGWADDFR